MRSRKEVVNLVNSWVGLNEKDGSFKKIIDIYNSYEGELPRKIKMQYNWAWCAATWSALAIKLGYTDIMPIEISCGFLIDQARKLDCWCENDGEIPEPGDAVLYDWSDNGLVSDNVSWPDHIGTVTYVNPGEGYFVVTEGNYDDQVKKRTVSINGRYIRGFIRPKYDKGTPPNPENEMQSGKSVKEVAHEVIAGVWKSGEARKQYLTQYGYDYRTIQNEVNRILNGSVEPPKSPIQDQNQPSYKTVCSTCYARAYDPISYSNEYVTTADLYCRNDAGTNKRALCVIPKGTHLVCWGYYTPFNKTNWLLVEVNIDKVKYVGFCSEHFLKEV